VIKGAEFNAAWLATDALKLSVNATYLNTRFTSFPAGITGEPTTEYDGVPCTLCGTTDTAENLAGKHLIRAPDSTFSVNGDYKFQNILGGDLVLSANLFVSASYYVDLNNETAQPAYTNLNTSLTWRKRDSGLYVSLQGRNMTDALISTQIYISGNGKFVTYEKPRNYVATVGYNF
jgi:iron complex outermembrane receptor protein